MIVDELIPWAKPALWGNERKYVDEALASTWISGGPYIERFEKEFREYSNVKHALATSNGTTAIHMAYLALGLGTGDEVIVPSFAFMAAANMALNVGATPVFADVDARTWCLDAASIEARITNRTKVIVPIHTFGNVCDMDAIKAVAARHKIPVIEDTAEAFSSRYKGVLAGTMTEMGTYSFQATKVITTGEGGMVTTNDDGLRDKMVLHRSHGMLRKVFYWHELPGQNFRLTNLQAALGVAQLEKLDEIIAGRQRVCQRYASLLSKMDGVRLQTFLPEVDALPWAVALLLDPKAFPQGRDEVLKQMREMNIETRPGFVAAAFMKHIFTNPNPTPVSDEISRQSISLPTYPTLTDEIVDYIVTSLDGLRK